MTLTLRRRSHAVVTILAVFLMLATLPAVSSAEMRRDGPPAQRVFKGWEASLAALGAPDAMTAAAGRGDVRGWCSSWEQFETADITGDGRSELIGVRCADWSGQGPTIIRAIDGASGTELWEREVAEPYVWVVPSRSASGAHALLIASFGYEFQSVAGEEVEAFTIQLSRVDGAGRDTWHRAFAGSITSTPAGRAALATPDRLTVLDDGAGVDLVVSSFDVTTAAGSYTRMARAEVVDGLTGATTAVSAVESRQGRVPHFAAASDVDGDGRQDYVALEPAETGGGQGATTAFDSLTGRRLWQSEELPIDTYVKVLDVGDVTGDGREEIALSDYDPAFGAYVTSLVDGASGALLWRKPMIGYRLGDVNGDGREEVGAQEMFVDHDRGVQGVRYAAYSDDGRDLLGVEYTVPGAGGRLLGGVIGDVDDDGIPDAWHEVYSGGASDNHVVSGRTGRPLWNSDGRRGTLRDARVMSDSVDGAGVDLLDIVHEAYREISVAPFDGATGTTLWRSAPVLGDSFDGFFSVDVSGDRRGDVIVTRWEWGDTEDTLTVTALDAATGAVLWENERRQVPP